MPDAAAPGPADLAEKCFKLDRRAWVRYPCQRETSCHPVTASSKVFWSGKVQNVSTGGIGLLLDRRFEPGTVLAITIQGVTEQAEHTVLVKVVHDTLVTAHPGLQWLIGCTFVRPLSEQELQALLL